jgi:hypothetical protein
MNGPRDVSHTAENIRTGKTQGGGFILRPLTVNARVTNRSAVRLSSAESSAEQVIHNQSLTISVVQRARCSRNVCETH